MINVNKLKSSLTPTQIIDILLSLGADCKKESDKELVFSSICCKENANERSPKLYYYISTQNFVCYRCNFSGDIIALVREIKHLSFIDALCWICDTIGVDPDVFGRKSIKQVDDWQHRLKKYLTRQSSDVELQVYDDKILNFFPKEYHQSWIDDGISIETMQKYEIAYYPYKQMITIPVRDDNNNLVGIHGRNLNPDVINIGLKYCPVKLLDKTEYKFPSSKILFGLNHTKQNIIDSKEVVIFEAPKSVLQMDSLIEKNNSVALFGTNCSKHNRDYLISLGVKRVVVALDRQYHEMCDDYGKFTEEFTLYKKKVEKICSLFSGYADVYVAYDNGHMLEYKDSPSDKGLAVWNKLYKDKELYES